jgi:hypothetical protein
MTRREFLALSGVVAPLSFQKKAKTQTVTLAISGMI